jgi:uridine kinase
MADHDPLPDDHVGAALARSPLLAGLPAGDRAALLSHAERVEVPAGAQVVREGDAAGEMYFVLAGEARLARNGLALKALGPGGHFGALGLLTGRPRSVSVTAASDLALARLSPERWAALSSSRPGAALRISLAVLGQIREELVEMTDQLGVLLQGRSLPRAREVSVCVGGEVRTVPTGTPVRSLLPEEIGGQLVVAALLGQKPVSLATPVYADAALSPLLVSEWEGRRVYTRSIGLILLQAAAEVLPAVPVRMGPSLGPTQIVEVPGAEGDLGAVAEKLTAAMERLVRADVPIRQELWAVEEAMALFEERGWPEAVDLLRIGRQAAVPLATCGGIYALAMGPLLPSAGPIRGFRIVPHDGALLIDYGERDPRSEGTPHPAPPQDGGMIEEHRSWLAAQGLTSVGSFNDVCIRGDVSSLIRVAEGFHEKRIGRIADGIAAARDRVRAICVAGPSASGKTTFIKRLSVQLQIDGLRPVGLSLDDYYVDRERTVRDEHGDYDFEALEAIDLPLLQAHVARLVAGERVRTARYDFRSGHSAPEGGAEIQLGEGDVLLLEGIHGLNPALLGGNLAPEQLYRIFIHPATTLPFDRLTRVSPTDLRLLRRIVRDRHARGYEAAANIQRWPSVQRGERRHIFPFQGEADAVFDSSLIYEPAVLKVYAERYLLEVPPDHPAYATAYRLRLLVDRFVAIYPDHVPPTSILREFIGGSGFEY